MGIPVLTQTHSEPPLIGQDLKPLTKLRVETALQKKTHVKQKISNTIM